MIKKIMIAGAVACLFSTGAWAANAPCPEVSNAKLAKALRLAIQQVNPADNLGLGLNMWATIVAPDGVVCAVANSSGDAIQGQWLRSRVISAPQSA